MLTPTYINILNVYAFCNTHDVTWGTKGDDKAEKLGSATVKPGGKVDVNIPQDDADLNTQYESELRLFMNKPVKETKVVSASEKQEDYYKGFRSAVVLVWMFCNFALAAVVLSAGGLENVQIGKDKATGAQRSTIYMAVVLWSVAGLSLFRFCGAVWFLIVRLVSIPLYHYPILIQHVNSSLLVPWRLIIYARHNHSSFVRELEWLAIFVTILLDIDVPSMSTKHGVGKERYHDMYQSFGE